MLTALSFVFSDFNTTCFNWWMEVPQSPFGVPRKHALVCYPGHSQMRKNCRFKNFTGSG
jgi:hypothetical protein